MRLVPGLEVKERIAAEDAWAVASEVVGQAEREEIVWVEGEEAEPKVIVIDGKS